MSGSIASFTEQGRRMRICATCQSTNSDDARFCKGCGQTLAPVLRSAPSSSAPAGSLVLSAIGLIIWGMGSLPWAINPNFTYSHSTLEKMTYIAWAAGPVLVAIGLLVAGASLSRRIGGAATSLGIVGLMLIGIAELPVAFGSSSTIVYRLVYAGPTIGFVLLGVGLLVAIPRVVTK